MRLSKNIKAAILNAAIAKSGIKEREAAIRSRYAAWAEAVRVRYVTPEAVAAFNSAMEYMKAVPECIVGQFPQLYGAQAIYDINVAGQNRTVYYCGSLSFNERVRGQPYLNSPCGELVLLAGDPLTEQLYAIDHDAKALRSEREQLTVSLNAVLDSVSTDKQLIAVWPEAVVFIPAAERAASPQLPALPIADLNRMVGLP